MAWTEEDSEKMDRAAAEASSELREIMKEMSPEQLVGATKIAKWVRENYRTAGYKRLMRELLSRPT